MTKRDVPAPYRYSAVVKPEWLDENGHMNVAYYMSVFDDGGEVFFQDPDIGWDYTRRGEGTVFVVSSKVDYRRELLVDEYFEVTTQLINFNNKLIHTYYCVNQGEQGQLAASAEILYMHIRFDTRRSAPMSPVVLARLHEILVVHQMLETPTGLGEGIGIKS